MLYAMRRLYIASHGNALIDGSRPSFYLLTLTLTLTLPYPVVNPRPTFAHSSRPDEPDRTMPDHTHLRTHRQLVHLCCAVVVMQSLPSMDRCAGRMYVGVHPPSLDM